MNQEDDRSLELTTSVALSHELELVDALEYAKLLDRAQLARLIRKKMDGPSLEQRWLKCVERLDIEQIDEFRKKFKNSSNKKELVILSLTVFLSKTFPEHIFVCQNFSKLLQNGPKL